MRWGKLYVSEEWNDVLSMEMWESLLFKVQKFIDKRKKKLQDL